MNELRDGIRCEACHQHLAQEVDELGRAVCALCVEPYVVELSEPKGTKYPGGPLNVDERRDPLDAYYSRDYGTSERDWMRGCGG